MNPEHESWERMMAKAFAKEYTRGTHPPQPEDAREMLLEPYGAMEPGHPLAIRTKKYIGHLVDRSSRMLAIMLYDGTANPYDQGEPIPAILLDEKDIVAYISSLQEALTILRCLPLKEREEP